MKGVAYKAKVRSFMYAMVATRPNLAFAVNTVSEIIVKASSSHWIAVKCIMRYLKGILAFKLCPGGKDIVLRRFCNTDWIENANDR